MNQEEKRSKTRQPAVSGQFYPEEPTQLKKALEKLTTSQEKKEATAIISPHAGYQYSGKTAGRAYSLLKEKRTIAIIGPNHTGIGAPVAVYPNGYWQTPLGKIPVQESKELLEQFWPDTLAHEQEHSIEVQLPFLQHTLKNFRIIPIAMLDQRPGTAKELAHALHKILDPKKDLLIATTDLTHYQPAHIAEEQDKKAIQAIENLDAQKLYQMIKQGLTMCGPGPTATAIEYARINRNKITNIDYTHSGKETGDDTQVVGYASFYAQ